MDEEIKEETRCKYCNKVILNSPSWQKICEKKECKEKNTKKWRVFYGKLKKTLLNKFRELHPEEYKAIKLKVELEND